MNVGRYQVLWWPRWRFWFRQPRATTRHWGLWQVYAWIRYVWPVEVRKFR